MLLGAAAGAFVGGGVALWSAFRPEGRSSKTVTALTVALGGPMMFAALWSVLEPLEVDLLAPQLVLGVAIASTAVAGRCFATRSAGGADRRAGGSPSRRAVHPPTWIR